MSSQTPQPPGNGFLGWLGRQVGYVRRAIKTDVGGPKTVYRAEKVEERPLPDEPNVILRRTTRDEVIVKPGKTCEPSNSQR